MTDGNQTDPEKEIIELSEIVVGTSADDDAIVELTEDLVDEVRDAISGFTGENNGDARELDLTDDSQYDNDSGTPDNEIIDLVEKVEWSTDFDPDEKIGDNGQAEIAGETTGEADGSFYTGPDIDTSGEPENQSGDILELTEVVESLSEQQLRDALERVVEQKYGDMIDQILREIIWKKVSEDIDHLREYLLTRRSGQ